MFDMVELVEGAKFSPRKVQLHRARMGRDAYRMRDYGTAEGFGILRNPDFLWDEAGGLFKRADSAGQKSYRRSIMVIDAVGLYSTILAKLLDARVRKDKEEEKRISDIQYYYLNIHPTNPKIIERTKLEFMSLLRGDMTLEAYEEERRLRYQQEIHNPKQEELNL